MPTCLKCLPQPNVSTITGHSNRRNLTLESNFPNYSVENAKIEFESMV